MGLSNLYDDYYYNSMLCKDKFDPVNGIIDDDTRLIDGNGPWNEYLRDLKYVYTLMNKGHTIVR